MLALWQLQGLLVSNGKFNPDAETVEMLLEVIATEESWVKSSALWFLGMSQDSTYAELYHDLLHDWSDRVTNAAAIALGKTRSAGAYEALVALQDKPSWKNQSLISALNGLQWLGDERGVELALQSLRSNEAKHWTLATPIWDHRLAAGIALNVLGETETAYDFIARQLEAAIEEEDLNDVLYNTLQIVNLADPRGREAFEKLKGMYSEDATVLEAIENYERQFLTKLKQK